MASEHSSCCEAKKSPQPKPWYQHRIVILIYVLVGLCSLSFAIPTLEPWRVVFFEYFKMMTWPLMVGFILGGIIDYFIPQEYISKHLAGNKKRTILYSAGLGFLMSACSHGILALSMELHKKGASGSAVISFLLASPWANLPITFLLIGFFGMKGFLIIFAALFVSINAGLIFQLLEKKQMIETNPHYKDVETNFSVRKDIARRLANAKWNAESIRKTVSGIWRGMVGLADMVIWWVLIGMMIASVVSAYVPDSIFDRFVGPSAAGLLVTLLIATVLEVCSEGTAALAFEFYRHTGAFGNAFVFLMGGVVTDYTEVGLVWKNLGKKTAIWMLVVTIPQVVLIGILFNIFIHA